MWAHIKRSFSNYVLFVWSRARISPRRGFFLLFLRLCFLFSQLLLSIWTQYSRDGPASWSLFFDFFLSLSVLCFVHVGAWSSDLKCAGWRKTTMIRNNYFIHWKLFSLLRIFVWFVSLMLSLCLHSLTRSRDARRDATTKRKNERQNVYALRKRKWMNHNHWRWWLSSSISSIPINYPLKKKCGRQNENWVDIHDRWRADRLIALWQVRAVFNEVKKREKQYTV
jgi:hypothetical protein